MMTVKLAMATSLAFAMLIFFNSGPVAATAPGFVLSAARFEGQGVGAVDQFDEVGNLIRSIAISGFPTSVTADRFGAIYVIVESGSDWGVQKYDSNGQFVDTIIGPDDVVYLGLGVDAVDRLYVGENFLFDRILRFELDGTPLGQFAPIATPGPGATFALEFDASGRLYVPDDNLIERFDSAGQSLGVFASVPTSFVIDLAFDSLGNLFAQTANDQIHVFNSAGAQIDALTSLSDNAISFDIDSDDILYVAGSERRPFRAFVNRYTADGVFIDTFFSGRPGEIFDVAIFEPIPEPTAASLMLLAVMLTMLSRQHIAQAS